MVEKPAVQKAVQFRGDVFSALESAVKLSHPLHKNLVYLFVWVEKFVPGIFLLNYNSYGCESD